MAGVCRHAAPYDRRGAGEEVRSGSVIRIRYGIQFKYIYFFFLPITLTGYFMLRSVKSRNLWLLFMSCFFYIFGGAVFFPIIVYIVLLNYTWRLSACLCACGREREAWQICFCRHCRAESSQPRLLEIYGIFDADRQ